MSDFHRLTTLDNLFTCWRHAKQAKSHSVRVQRFAADPLHYLTLIQQRLRDREYAFGPYRRAKGPAACGRSRLSAGLAGWRTKCT